MEPGLAEVHSNLGLIYFKERKLDEAVAQYRAVLALDPRRPGIHYRIGRTLVGQTGGTSSMDNPTASEEFERELEIDPTNANAAYELGEIFRKSGQMEKAREYFERAL